MGEKDLDTTLSFIVHFTVNFSVKENVKDCTLSHLRFFL